jgi:hemolysin D
MKSWQFQLPLPAKIAPDDREGNKRAGSEKRGAFDRLSPELADFAPGLLAIQDSPPARLPRAVLYTVGSLFAVLAIWTVFAKVDIVAVAEGRLVPQSFVKIVQPAEAGIVSQILVKDGDAVAAGQVLMRLDPKLAETDRDTMATEVAIKQLSLRRIDAELRGLVLVRKVSDPPAVFEQVAAQYRAHRQSYLDSVAQENEVLKRAQSDLLASQAILSKLEQTLPSYRQSAEAHHKLVKEGFISALANSEKQRELTEKQQDLKAQQSVVTSTRHVIAQSQMKLAQLKSSYDSQLLAERMEVDAQLNKVTGEMSKHEHKSKWLELRAPQAGIVKDLATHTVGTVVAPGTVMMNLVPIDEPLQAEVLVKNEDVGFTAPGQLVKVKLATFAFQKYGMLEGSIAHLSADAISSGEPNKQNEAGIGPTTYRALVKLHTQQLQAPSGERLRLAPGMQVTVEVHQGQRTILEYLISPVQKVRQEAARER